MKTYPRPAEDVFNLSVQKDNLKKVHIVDINSRLV